MDKPQDMYGPIPESTIMHSIFILAGICGIFSYFRKNDGMSLHSPVCCNRRSTETKIERNILNTCNPNNISKMTLRCKQYIIIYFIRRSRVTFKGDALDIRYGYFC